jgi:hypothetical protein
MSDSLLAKWADDRKLPHRGGGRGAARAAGVRPRARALGEGLSCSRTNGSPAAWPPTGLTLSSRSPSDCSRKGATDPSSRRRWTRCGGWTDGARSGLGHGSRGRARAGGGFSSSSCSGASRPSAPAGAKTLRPGLRGRVFSQSAASGRAGRAGRPPRSISPGRRGRSAARPRRCLFGAMDRQASGPRRGSHLRFGRGTTTESAVDRFGAGAGQLGGRRSSRKVEARSSWRRGKAYDIRVEYFNGGDRGLLQLYWCGRGHGGGTHSSVKFSHE